MKAEEKFIVITGVTRGLGRAMTTEFARRGCVVAGCGRSRAEIEQLRTIWRAPHDFEIVDVASEDQVGQWAQTILRKFRPPDFVINNAALINRNAALWKISAGEFDAVVDVNIKGVANVIRHFAPAMVERRRGIIVNFSSGWGRATAPEVAPYCATKWAIEGLTQALAQELPSGMAAVALNPGIINTEMLQSCFGASAGAYPSSDEWAKTAAPFILKLAQRHNGQSVTAHLSGDA